MQPTDWLLVTFPHHCVMDVEALGRMTRVENLE
jgi:hypothetical protein